MQLIVCEPEKANVRFEDIECVLKPPTIGDVQNRSDKIIVKLHYIVSDKPIAKDDEIVLFRPKIEKALKDVKRVMSTVECSKGKKPRGK